MKTDGTTPSPLSTVCKNYAEHYANNPSIKRAIEASSEMETMIRQMFGSCISGENYPEQCQRDSPARGPVTGMVIQATNSKNEHVRRFRPVSDSEGEIGKHNDMKIDDDMSAITALTLEEMEKISNLKRNGIARQADRFIAEAKNQRYLQGRNNVHEVGVERMSLKNFEPSSRFEPNFGTQDGINYLQEESRVEYNKHPVLSPTLTRREPIAQNNRIFPQTTPRQVNQFEYNYRNANSGTLRKETRENLLQGMPRVVTPPKSPLQNSSLDMQSSKSSGSRSARSNASHSFNHPHDHEMKSSDKTYVKSRLNCLQKMVNNNPHSIGQSRLNNSSTCTSRSSRRGDKRNSRQNTSASESMSEGSFFEGNKKVHKMQMYDGTFLEFTDDDKYGEI